MAFSAFHDAAEMGRGEAARIVVFALSYWAALLLHEIFHLAGALVLGSLALNRDQRQANTHNHRHGITLNNFKSAFFHRCVRIQGFSGWQNDAVRLSGWLGSLLLFLLAIFLSAPIEVVLAVAIIAAESFTSDVLLIGSQRGSNIFNCGNFGILLLDKDKRDQVLGHLKTMIRVTMMRGAQSGGVVTFVPQGEGLRGVRSRVVNGKRTDLSELVTEKLWQDEMLARCRFGLGNGPRIYAGHTRFATTSKATLDGTHPHQWTPRETLMVWTCEADGQWRQHRKNIENFICHNGDLDAWEFGGQVHSLDNLREWLVMATHSPAPSMVDSVCIAGIIDLLRTKGSWYHSIRFGFLFGPRREGLKHAMPTKSEIHKLAEIAEIEFRTTIKDVQTGAGVDILQMLLSERLAHRFAGGALGLSQEGGDLKPFVHAATRAFFQQDLFHAAQMFLTNAKGSFGLLVSSSLDAHRQVALGARGQTMSIAFFPKSGMVLWASEQAAVKAVVAQEIDPEDDATIVKRSRGPLRLDLDDLSGEVCLIDWGDPNNVTSSVGFAENVLPRSRSTVSVRGTESSRHNAVDQSSRSNATKFSIDVVDRSGRGIDVSTRSGFSNFSIDVVDKSTRSGDTSSRNKGRKKAEILTAVPKVEAAEIQEMMLLEGRVTVILAQEDLKKLGTLRQRFVPLTYNPVVTPLPPMVPDPVGADIAQIPMALDRIQNEWRTGTSINNLTMWWLGRDVCERLKMREQNAHDGSVDLLLTGCEVSLWLLEQFASDLGQIFPNLCVKALSANKLLGLLGQELPIPQTGHQLNEQSWKLNNTIVLIASHSGGTFSSLACSNLLQAYTKRIYVISSELDTQIGKQLRQLNPNGNFRSFIFSTGVGLRPAEPCSLSVAAMHQVLTQILLTLMRKVQQENLEEVSGGAYLVDDYFQLEELNSNNISALEDIVGFNKSGQKTSSATAAELRGKGAYWAQHVLETPISWIMCFIYICATVITGRPLVLGIARSVGLDATEQPEVGYALAAADALIYVFCPQWCCLLLRVVQGRTMLHRMTGRTVVVGDIPWVSQCVEAFLSKLFACSYSAAGLTVFSANPMDHLVHRLTHRVVRGTLLACGRPDGRLFALTSAENSVCLSVNQASSIQSIGSTCESLTIGHNDFKLPLSKHHVVLKGCRKQYLCERLLQKRVGGKKEEKQSSGELLGAYSNLRRQAGVLEHQVEDLGHGLTVFRRVNYTDTKKALSLTAAQRENLEVAGIGETYYGQYLEKFASNIPGERLMEEQVVSMRLYESRIASLQRAVAMFVMFHEMGKRVQSFWPSVSLGFLRYDMSRSHSIMRIATTASPISGSDVRERTIELAKAMRIRRGKLALLQLVHQRRRRQEALDQLATDFLADPQFGPIHQGFGKSQKGLRGELFNLTDISEEGTMHGAQSIDNTSHGPFSPDATSHGPFSPEATCHGALSPDATMHGQPEEVEDHQEPLDLQIQILED